MSLMTHIVIFFCHKKAVGTKNPPVSHTHTHITQTPDNHLALGSSSAQTAKTQKTTTTLSAKRHRIWDKQTHTHTHTQRLPLPALLWAFTAWQTASRRDDDYAVWNINFPANNLLESLHHNLNCFSSACSLHFIFFTLKEYTLIMQMFWYCCSKDEYDNIFVFLVRSLHINQWIHYMYPHYD